MAGASGFYSASTLFDPYGPCHTTHIATWFPWARTSPTNSHVYEFWQNAWEGCTGAYNKAVVLLCENLNLIVYVCAKQLAGKCFPLYSSSEFESSNLEGHISVGCHFDQTSG